MKNSNLYNDKELFEDADLNWYDYGFRNYDAQIGRFPQLDPLTDDYPYYTPYQYAGNEPIANVDLDGLEEFKVLAPVVVPGLSKSAQSASINIFKLSTQIIPKISQIAAVHSEQSLVKLQIQSFPPKAKEAPTFSQRQDYFVSDIQKSVNAHEAGYNPDGSLMFWAKAAKNKTWNNFANNIVFSPAADFAGLAVGVGELRFALKYAAKRVTAEGAVGLRKHLVVRLVQAGSLQGKQLKVLRGH